MNGEGGDESENMASSETSSSGQLWSVSRLSLESVSRVTQDLHLIYVTPALQTWLFRFFVYVAIFVAVIALTLLGPIANIFF